jgi:hypothetical protein
LEFFLSAHLSNDPVLRAHSAHGSEDINDLHPVRASFYTRATRGAKPEILSSKLDKKVNLSLVNQFSCKEAADQIPGTGGCTEATLVTGFQSLSPSLDNLLG